MQMELQFKQQEADIQKTLAEAQEEQTKAQLDSQKMQLKAQLDALADELRFVLIASKAEVSDAESTDAVATDVDGLSVSVVKAAGEKCERCWHHRADVGTHAEHETICGRCVDNVFADGEARSFA